MSKRNKSMSTQTITRKDVGTLKLTSKPAGATDTAAKLLEQPKPTPAAPATVVAKPLVIKVLKRDAVYRGARAAWYARLLEFDGKTEGEYLASTKETPPALTRNQTAENPTGWVSWFKRQGVISLSAAA